MKYINIESPLGATVVFNGKVFDYFAGTSYYGLHGHPRIKKAVRRTQSYFTKITKKSNSVGLLINLLSPHRK